jgi:predicted  nucleic acid-binding Zn-ribbon protein
MRPVTCTNCQTRFALGLLACPRCRTVSPQYAANVKKEEVMPHTTVGGGPSNAGAQPGEVGYVGRAEHKAAEVVKEAVAEAKAEVHAAEDWASKPLAHLREAAKNRGLPTAGNKADLAARLDEHEAAQDTPEPAKANAAPAAEEVSA